MSKKQWMVLLMLFLIYLLLGASIFYHIESKLEVEKVQKAREERIEINGLLHAHYMPESAEDQHEILEKLTIYCGKSVYNYSENESDPLKWDFYNSFYFAYTVVSTIGYGNLAPTNMLSRILMTFYALIGIPMNGILLAQLGEFFSTVFIRAHEKYKSYKKHHQDEYKKKLTPLETRKAGLAAQILMYLAPGFVMFIFFPAFLFSFYEGWTYEEAVYYAFVTLTTIGFGDYVAGQDNTKGSGFFFIMYKSFLIAWISFGLGYLLMIMTFITRGMRSKKIVRLEHKLAMNLKQTQSKILGEFNKEVAYLRRVFNELQLSKVKRIYVDEYDYEIPPACLPRSNSFPDLRELIYGGLIPVAPPHPRRRANSEVVPMESPVPRVVSETDLQRIDKTATFATHAMVQPAELLARLVNVLGYIPPPPDEDEQPQECDPRGGVEGFSEKEILANEHANSWKQATDRFPRGKPRSRTTSEVRLDTKFDSNVSRNQEWTWSGPAASRKIQEIIRARRNGINASKEKEKESKSIFPGLNLPKSVPLPKWIKQLSNKKDGKPRNSASVGDLDANDESYLSNINPLPSTSTYFTHTGANLPSSLEGSNLLEETSLADFLRALTALHTRVGAVPEDYIKKPQRKLGLASLTPPKLPSLLTLFSPPGSLPQSNQTTLTDAATGRRFSLRPVETSGNSTPNYNRRSSLAPAIKTRNRRFSLRPVPTPLGTTPEASPHLSGHHGTVAPAPPEFLSESPKEPLVKMESSPGISSPVASSNRRFSLRSAQLDTVSVPGTPPTAKALPRWRAGMLQRQINQIHLQKRARALSLSDVNTEEIRNVERNFAISPLALESAIKMNPGKSSNQKTVTIVSPNINERGKSNDAKQMNQRTRVPFSRAASASSNSGDVNSGNNSFFNEFEGSRGDGTETNDRTVAEILKDVKTIKTAANVNGIDFPLDSQSKRSDTGTSEVVVNLDSANREKIAVEKNETPQKARKTSLVSIGSWNDVKRGERKVSTVSEQSTSDSSSSSRKTSSSKSSSDKSRISADSYKPLLEIRIDALNENIPQRLQRVSTQSAEDADSLQEVKIDAPGESKEKNVEKIDIGMEEGPGESTT